MLIEKNVIREEDFKKEFIKKFDNFCRKRPVLINYSLSNKDLYLDIDFKTYIKIFEIDYTQDVKEFIKEIDDWLKFNAYPKMNQVSEIIKDITDEEVKDLLGSEDLEKKLFQKTKEVKTIVWRIEKIILSNDILFVRNLETDEFYRYKLEKIMLSSFLKNLKKKWTPEEAWNKFMDFAVLLNEIDPNFVKQDNL